MQKYTEQSKEKKDADCYCKQNTRPLKTEDITLLSCLLLLLQHLELCCVHLSRPLCLIDCSLWTCVSLCVCIRKESKTETERTSVRVYLCMWDIVSSYVVIGTEMNGGGLVLKSGPLEGRRESERTERPVASENPFGFSSRLLRHRKGRFICLPVWKLLSLQPFSTSGLLTKTDLVKYGIPCVSFKMTDRIIPSLRRWWNKPYYHRLIMNLY